MTRRQKPGRITLERMYPVCQYAAAVLLAISYPSLPAMINVLPQVSVPRACIMLWVALLLGFAWLMDIGYIRAALKDRRELQEKVRNGGMNRSTLLALGVPVLFIVNCVAIVHLYYVLSCTGQSVVSGTPQFTPQAAVMSIGIVLWIYGRRLPGIRFGSIWGIRTKATLKDQKIWYSIHRKAALPVMACGFVTLLSGTFLAMPVSLVVAVGCCAAAFTVMFLLKAE